MEMFEKAAKKKLRFDNSRGQISSEDLFDLSLQTLDTMAKAVNKKLKEDSEESFIQVKTPSNTDNQLRLDILKHVIKIKIDARDAAAARMAKQEKLAQIKTLLANKSDEALANKSIEELQQLMGQLESEEVVE